MSRETVELVQSMYRPGDPSRFFNLIHEEVEAEFDAAAAPLLPDYPQRIHGKTAVIDFYRHYWGPGTTMSWSPPRSSTQARTGLLSFTMSEAPEREAGRRSSADGASSTPFGPTKC
jgi:hypothetical protein